MYILVSKFLFLEFRLLLSRVAPYYELYERFVTANCWKDVLILVRLGVGDCERVEVPQIGVVALAFIFFCATI